MKIFIPFVLASCLLMICSCSSKKQTNAELFEKYKDINVEGCMIPLIEKGINKDTARIICDCMLETFYAMDSTFLQMSEEEYEVFLQKNMAEMKKICMEALTK